MHLPHHVSHILSLAGLSQLRQVNKVPLGAKVLPGPGTAALAAGHWHSAASRNRVVLYRSSAGGRRHELAQYIHKYVNIYGWPADTAQLAPPS